MDLKEHYQYLYTTAVPQISLGNYEIDPWIKSNTDNRLGLSLVLRPSTPVKNEIQTFLSELKKEAPGQYYYPSSDIHITLLSIISCHDGFDIDQIELSKYIAVIQELLKETTSFTIHFKGVTASTSCLMIQGFMEHNSINLIRDRLREGIHRQQLPQSMDKRYTLHTAHATVFRFSQTLENKNTFLEVVEKYRDYDFGAFEVHNIEFVLNDWYQRASCVQRLHHFKLTK